MRLLIRLANIDDHMDIDTILRASFPGPEEAELVHRLAEDGDIVFSLVAEIDGRVCAMLILSAMSAPFRALGLAPVAVLPEYQRQGIAGALIHEGIELACVEQWDGIFVLGDPEYYQRFGFLAETAAGFDNPYASPYLMALSLGPGPLPATEGKVDYAKAFAAL